MFVLRLAAKYGIPPQQVDAFHDSLTQEQLDEQRALAVIDGWYHGRTLESEIRAELHNQTNRQILLHADNAERAAEKMDWKSGGDYLRDYESLGEKQQEDKRKLSVEQARKALEAKYDSHN